MLNRFIPFATTKTFRTPVRTTGRIQVIRSCYHLSYIAVKEYQVGDNMCVTARHSHIACFLWQALWRCSRARFRTQYTRWFSCDPDHRVPRGVWGRLCCAPFFPSAASGMEAGDVARKGQSLPHTPQQVHSRGFGFAFADLRLVASARPQILAPWRTRNP
jgi:hypothetical protein